MPGVKENLEALLATGRDDALLRYSLGSAWLEDEPATAAKHLARAVVHDPDYSAAWKLLGKARAALGDTLGAKLAYAEGIRVAEGRGDLQAAKEMKVFLARLER